MEKQMTLTANAGIMRKCSDIVKKAAGLLGVPQQRLRRYYSAVLGTEVDPARARAITEAQLAFFAVTLPADYPLALRVLACVWFVTAARRLKGKN